MTTKRTTDQPAPATQPASPDHVGADAPRTPARPDQAHGADPARSDATDRLLSAALTGAVKFYRVRANGSTRAVPYLPPDSEAREVADYLAWQVEEEGQTVAQVATDTGLSRATVRRALAAVQLADDIEWDDGLAAIYQEGVEAIYLSALNDPANAQFEIVEDEEEA